MVEIGYLRNTVGKSRRSPKSLLRADNLGMPPAWKQFDFQNKRNMEFYASGKKKFYLPKSNYQPNIDAGLLAHVREEVFKREEEQRKQKEIDDARKAEDEQRTKLGRQIHSIVTNLPITYQEKMTLDVINSLALSLMDGTVFEIVRGLEDIQQLTERNLLNKRMKLINSQKAERMEQNKTHKAAIDACSNKPHHLPVVRKKHTQEKENLESRLEQELVQLDQKLVLELDRVVADQQTTMQRAGVPMFHLTNDSSEIQLQMYILDIVTKLSGS